VISPALDLSLLLFVAGDRPDRYPKGLASGASGVIIDLEDAVAPEKKAEAREHVRAFLEAGNDLARVVVRVSPPGTEQGGLDLAMLAGAPRVAACMVPKVESAVDLAPVDAALPNLPQIALIETARGLVRCEAVAEAKNLIALAFGPYDLAAALGAEADSDVLLPHRARVLVAARAAGRAALDGPSREYGSPAVVARDAKAACRLGYDGKLLIHPLQIAPVRAAFEPAAEEVAYARRVVQAARGSSPAVLDGTMIDAPILALAERTLRRAGHEVRA
jgi:citrate lyase subunit beta/citryl-CoA lyase